MGQIRHMVSRQKIIQIFKASPTPTSIIKADDPAFTFVEVNDAYTAMTQTFEKEIIGKSLFQIFPENPKEAKPTGVERLRNSFRKVIAEKQEDKMEAIRYDIMLDDGKFKQIYWEVINTPVFDEKGDVELIINSATNITERVLSERTKKLMLNNSEDSFILINKDMIIQSFNDHFAKNYKDIFGIEVNKGYSILDYAQPERRETVRDIYERVFEGETIESELPIETNSGITRFFNIKYKPARDENDAIIGSFVSLLENTEEHIAKLKLQKSEEHFRALVENGNDVLVILTKDGEATYISPSILNVLGYTQDEAYNMDLIQIVHPDDVSLIYSELERCMDKPGVPLEVAPARMKHKNGEYRWMEATITNMLHDPAISGIIDNFRDITDRIKYQEAIAEAKEKYQTLIQTIDGVVWEAEPGSLHVTYMSPQSLPILGHDSELWASTVGFWKDHIHPDDREETYAKFVKLTKTGKNHELEYRYEKGNGEYIWVRDVVTVITENGIPEVIRGVIIDINKEKELQIELDQVHRIASIGNWEVDLLNDQVYWSDVVKRTFEVDPDFKPELKNLAEIYAEDAHQNVLEKAVEKAIEEGISYDLELQIITAKGNKKWIRNIGKPDFRNGKCVRIYGTTQDITERKEAEIELRKSNEDLIERIKEQRCLYDITSLKEQELSVHELLKKAVKIIPNGWQNPELTEVEITWNNERFVSTNFRKSKWKLNEKISRSSSGTFSITVSYVNDEQLNKDPFLQEEKYLLKAIIEQLSLKVEQITQRNELQDQRYKMQRILNQSADIICTTKDNKFTSINAACERILGYTPDEMIGKSLFDFIAKEDLEKTNSVSEAVEKDDVMNFENHYIHKDGHIVPIIWSARWDEKEGQIYATGRDATEIKAIEKEKEFERLNKNALINSTEDLVWSIDQNLNLITANEAFKAGVKEQIGIDIEPGEFVMKGIDESIEYRKTWLEYYKRALSGESFRIETHEPTDNNDEAEYWHETSFNPIYDGKKITGVACFARNISEAKQAQQKVKRAEEKFRNVVEHSTNMFYQHDVNGVLGYVSPQSKKFLGYSPEEAKRSWTEFITDHPINKEGEKITQKALETGEVQEPYELQLITADNRIIWVEVNEAPLVKNGEVLGIVGSLTDITDRKKYEKQLKQSLERYDYVSKASRDAIYDWDITNDNIHWGEGFRTLFGHKAGLDKYPLKNWSKLVHSDDVEETQRDLKFTLADSSMDSWSSEYRFKKAQGGYAYVVENGYIIRNEDGKAIRMIGALRDVTESKKREIQNEIQRNIAHFFKEQEPLDEILEKALGYLADYGKFETAEIWLKSSSTEYQNLIATFSRKKKGQTFYESSQNIRQFAKGEGLPGTVWNSKEIEIWDNITENISFIRRKAAKKANITSAYGIPLFHKEDFTGVLLLSSTADNTVNRQNLELFEGLQEFLGAEIKRKQQEEEFKLLFESAPEILAVATPNGHFTKVNPSFCELLGYSEQELISQPLINFLHPEDTEDTLEEYNETKTGDRQTENFVNRYITKSGETVYISWYSSDIFGEDGHFFAYGRDVTETVELEKLLKLTNRLAKVGSWELDLSENNKDEKVYWSEMTREIFEVPDEYDPNLSDDLEYFKPESRKILQDAVQQATEAGTAYDLELEILTAEDHSKWVRCIGSAEFINGECKRLFGSIQDITEKKTAEIEIEKAFKEKETILESIGDAFFAVDHDWTVTYWNKEAENVLMKPREEIIGRNLWEEYDDAVELKFYSEYHKAVDEKTMVHFEEFYPDIEKWFEVSAYPSPNGLSVFFKDVTEKKVIQQEIKETHDKLKVAQEIAKLGYWELKLDTNKLYWSDEVYRIWGLKEQGEPLNFEKFRETIHPDDLEEFDEKQEKALTGEEELNIEHRIVLQDGTVKWVHEIGNTTLDKNNNIVSFQGTVQDITAQKKAKLEVENTLKEKEAILESIEDGFFTVNENWTVTYWNRAAERMLHTPKQDIVGQNLWDVFSEAVDLPSYTNYHRAMHQNINVDFEDYWDGLGKWFDISAYPSPDGISVFFKDITERKKASEKLEQLNTELKQRADELAASNAELEQFAYVASHDLQEPLRMVTSFLTQLDKKYSDDLDEKANEYIHYAVDGAQRMRQIILDLLNYSRLNKDQAERETVDLNELLEDAKSMERNHIQETNAKIISDKLPALTVNPGAIKQVFQNLLNNAIKYQKSGVAPKITIQAKELDKYWQFSFSDNGIGINEEFQDTIFQIFQRLHTRDHYSGTGIGLAITKKIIERHEGKIWVESEEGSGSTFYFTLKK